MRHYEYVEPCGYNEKDIRPRIVIRSEKQIIEEMRHIQDWYCRNKGKCLILTQEEMLDNWIITRWAIFIGYF